MGLRPPDPPLTSPGTEQPHVGLVQAQGLHRPVATLGGHSSWLVSLSQKTSRRTSSCRNSNGTAMKQSGTAYGDKKVFRVRKPCLHRSVRHSEPTLTAVPGRELQAVPLHVFAVTGSRRPALLLLPGVMRKEPLWVVRCDAAPEDLC